MLLTQDLESPSGLGRYKPLATELSRLGHSVHIVALHSNYQKLENKYHSEDGFRVSYIGQMHVLKEGNQKQYFSKRRLFAITAKATWGFSRTAINYLTDIIHIAKPHPMNSIAGILAKYLRNIPFLLDCDDYEAASGRFSSRWEEWLISKFEQWTPRKASIVTTNTFFMKEKLI